MVSICNCKFTYAITGNPTPIPTRETINLDDIVGTIPPDVGTNNTDKAGEKPGNPAFEERVKQHIKFAEENVPKKIEEVTKYFQENGTNIMKPPTLADSLAEYGKAQAKMALNTSINAAKLTGSCTSYRPIACVGLTMKFPCRFEVNIAAQYRVPSSVLGASRNYSSSIIPGPIIEGYRLANDQIVKNTPMMTASMLDNLIYSLYGNYKDVGAVLSAVQTMGAVTKNTADIISAMREVPSEFAQFATSNGSLITGFRAAPNISARVMSYIAGLIDKLTRLIPGIPIPFTFCTIKVNPTWPFTAHDPKIDIKNPFSVSANLLLHYASEAPQNHLTYMMNPNILSYLGRPEKMVDFRGGYLYSSARGGAMYYRPDLANNSIIMNRDRCMRCENHPQMGYVGGAITGINEFLATRGGSVCDYRKTNERVEPCRPFNSYSFVPAASYLGGSNFDVHKIKNSLELAAIMPCTDKVMRQLSKTLNRNNKEFFMSCDVRFERPWSIFSSPYLNSITEGELPPNYDRYPYSNLKTIINRGNNGEPITDENINVPDAGIGDDSVLDVDITDPNSIFTANGSGVSINLGDNLGVNVSGNVLGFSITRNSGIRDVVNYINNNYENEPNLQGCKTIDMPVLDTTYNVSDTSNKVNLMTYKGFNSASMGIVKPEEVKALLYSGARGFSRNFVGTSFDEEADEVDFLADGLGLSIKTIFGPECSAFRYLK